MTAGQAVQIAIIAFTLRSFSHLLNSFLPFTTTEDYIGLRASAPKIIQKHIVFHWTAATHP